MTISDDDFDALCRRLYLQLKDGTVDREAAFDLACEVLSDQPLDADATELARLCLEDGSESGIAAAARTFLFSAQFDPGFARGTRLADRARRSAGDRQAGHARLRPAGDRHLYIWEGGNAFVEVWDRCNSHGSGCHPASGSDPVTALATVADDAQDAVMHAIFGAWPVCVAHSLGTHAEERDGTAVWWCSGAGGHIAALIGQWPA